MTTQMEMEAKISKNKIVIVDYPGVVCDEKKMLESLGGLENVTKVYKDPMKRLDMKWRPKDVFSKPMCADRRPTHTLLLKVKKKDKEDDEGESSSTELEGEIVGVAESVFKFESLADFQYLAMKTKEDMSGYEPFYDKIVPSKSKKLTPDWMEDRDAPLFLPSPIYSRLDKSVEYAYKDKPTERKERAPQPEGAITLDRAKRPHFSKFHSFKMGEVPKEPYKEALERLHKKASYKIELQNIKKLKELFKERPLWTKIAIQEVTRFARDTLKYTLPIVAYYWDTGPWRTMWCVYGYDPRKETSAKQYQLLDFRLKGNSFEDIQVKRSSTKDYNLPGMVVRSGTQQDVPKIRHSDLGGETRVPTVTAKDRDSLWKFNPNVIPPQRQFFYQLMDIDVEEVQEIVHSNDGQEKECTERDGWCVKGYADKVRQIMSSLVVELLERRKKEESAGTASEDLAESLTKKQTAFYPMKTRKGKSGPKHKVKSSMKATSGTTSGLGGESEEDSNLMDVSHSRLEGKSEESGSDDGDDADSLSGSEEDEDILVDRELRAKKVLHDLGEGADSEFEMLTDSDDDPDYNPLDDS